jgi:hypothetical protein
MGRGGGKKPKNCFLELQISEISFDELLRDV